MPHPFFYNLEPSREDFRKIRDFLGNRISHAHLSLDELNYCDEEKVLNLLDVAGDIARGAKGILDGEALNTFVDELVEIAKLDKVHPTIDELSKRASPKDRRSRSVGAAASPLRGDSNDTGKWLHRHSLGGLYSLPLFNLRVWMMMKLRHC